MKLGVMLTNCNSKLGRELDEFLEHSLLLGSDFNSFGLIRGCLSDPVFAQLCDFVLKRIDGCNQRL